jgi:UDP-N-acetylmuramoyl-tripeptide--D-alanyl-D-alanine ligase
MVIAITGSYGKTSTKLYTAHLLSGCFRTQASPASFNNRAGLSRAINEQLLDSTEIFVAEMGTYGQGEIREMCSWMKPKISAITAIGPVHLERMKSEERILQAKSEITETASTVVLQVDDPRLGELARHLENNGKRVIRCSSGRSYPADAVGLAGSVGAGDSADAAESSSSQLTDQGSVVPAGADPAEPASLETAYQG